jgi:hypothetical protein
MTTWMNELRRNGWASFRESTSSTLQIALTLGLPVPAQRNGDVIQLLRPLPEDSAPPNSLSAAHGLNGFPLHTDAAHHPVPPRYIVMRLTGETSTRCATVVVPFSSLAFDLPALAAFRRDVWIVNAGQGKFTTTILDSVSMTGQEILRYDAACMRPASKAFSPSGELMETGLASATKLRFEWTPGSFLVVDNWRVLHGREPAVHDQRRVLERILVQ